MVYAWTELLAFIPDHWSFLWIGHEPEKFGRADIYIASIKLSILIYFAVVFKEKGWVYISISVACDSCYRMLYLNLAGNDVGLRKEEKPLGNKWQATYSLPRNLIHKAKFFCAKECSRIFFWHVLKLLQCSVSESKLTIGNNYFNVDFIY